MARLLVKAVDYTHPDPAVDRKAAYKRGDVVVVMPDGHEWGKQEGPPTFAQVDMPGVSVEQVKRLVNSEEETLAEITSRAVRKNPRLLRLVNHHKPRNIKTRRRYRLDLMTNAITDKTR